MIDEHERLQEDVAAYALGALDAAERERVEAHLRACDECPRLLAEYRQIGDLLPHALPLQVPPSAVRDELLARARASKLLRGTTPLGPYPMKAGVADVGRPKPANTLTRVLRPLGWAAAVAALLVLLIWNIMLQMQLNNWTNPRGSVLVATPSALGASGQLSLTPDRRMGTLRVIGLPPLAAGKVYQFWFARPDKSRDSAGTFKVDARGEALVSVTVPGGLEQYNQVWVTVENEGKPPNEPPTPPHYLEGPIF